METNFDSKNVKPGVGPRRYGEKPSKQQQQTKKKSHSTFFA